MVETYRRLWFRTAVVTLDDPKIQELHASGRYALITALSYAKLDLPGFRRFEKDTSLISLAESEDDIFARMKDTTRNEIRRTASSDALSFEGPVALAHDVYLLYADFERAQGRTPIREREAGTYQYFVARHEGAPVSAISVRAARPYLRTRSIFSKRLAVDDKEYKKVIGNASRRLVWDICRWGKREGYASLDMASVNLSDAGKRGITNFKLSFGGAVAKEYTYIYKSRIFALLESFVILRMRLRAFAFGLRKRA